MKITIIKPMVVLARHTSGVDWGNVRKLVAQLKTKPERLLMWIPGHTSWISRGATGYYYGSLNIQIMDGSHNTRSIEADDLGGTPPMTLNKVLKNPTAVAWIRKHFLDSDELIAAVGWKHTTVVTP